MVLLIIMLSWYFYILSRRPHCIWTWWFVLYIAHKPIVDDIYMLVCVACGPWSTWLMRWFVLSEELWIKWVINVVLSEKLSSTRVFLLVLSVKLSNTLKDKLEVLGIRPRAFHFDVEHKLSNIGSLAIVSLGVLYMYILAFSVEWRALELH